jgi:hypothetical protein
MYSKFITFIMLQKQFFNFPKNIIFFLVVRGLKLPVAAAGSCQSLTDRKPPEWANCTEEIPICTMYLRELLLYILVQANICSSICL